MEAFRVGYVAMVITKICGIDDPKDILFSKLFFIFFGIGDNNVCSLLFIIILHF